MAMRCIQIIIQCSRQGSLPEHRRDYSSLQGQIHQRRYGRTWSNMAQGRERRLSGVDERGQNASTISLMIDGGQL